VKYKKTKTKQTVWGWVQWLIPVIAATQETEMRIKARLGIKVNEILSQQKSWGLVAHTCYHSNVEGVSKRILAGEVSKKSIRSNLKTN
jgi:hypothetical protein